MTKKSTINKIVLFMGDHARHVCPVIRVFAPAKMAGIEVFQGNERIDGKFKLHLDRIADADMVVIQRDFPADIDAYEQVIQMARDSGKCVLYDIDDLLIDLPQEHPDTERYIPGRFPILRAITEADAVTVASETLKSHLQDFNPNIHVLPNYLLDEVWENIQLPYADETDEDGPITIGYMGGHSHRPDLDMVEPVLRRILDRYDEEIRLQFWGIEPSPGLAGDPRVSAAHLQYADYDQFSEYLSQQTADILIAPLKDSSFNRSKSWLKFLEYSALGAPGVYSNLEPYREIVQDGKTGYLASTLNEWHDYLTKLIEDPGLRKKIGEKAFKDVRENYMLSDHVHQWKELYERVTADRGVETGRVYLENSLGLASRWQGEIAADRARKEEELSSAREEVQVLSETLNTHKEDLARIQKAFDDLAVQHDQVNKALAHFEKYTAEQSQKIEEIASQLAESRKLNQLIPDMQSQLKEKDGLIADQQTRLQTKDRLIADQESRLGEQEDRRVRLQAESSVYRTSRLLRFTIKIQHRLSHLRINFLRRLRRRRELPLFDPEWYLGLWPDVKKDGVDPYTHYIQSGWREGRDPSPYFDVIWYLRTYPDVLEAGAEPLGHYIHHGRWENRRPHPGLPKDCFPMHQSIWLPIQHRPDSGTGGWRRKASFRWKLLRLRQALRSGRITVPALFDAEWYLAQWPDVASSKIHPYLHYLTQGWLEGRDPHPNFNVRRYLENNPDVRDAGIEPFEHFCTYGWLEGRNPRPEIGTTAYMLGRRHDPYVGLVSILSINAMKHPAPGARSPPPQKKRSTLQAEVDRWESTQEVESAFGRRETLSTYESEEIIPLESPLVKLIAFYLPQFHPIPENDEFWGEGFTEWTNVVKARPLFEGHYQPRLPGDLGFYDLRLAEVMQRQAELAKTHGIYGFCFHHYWFNGKRVLERPVDQFLEHPEIDMPFCLNWANENWTRRWDGYDEDILLRQDHSTEDDLSFIADAMRYFKDPRYIRIENRPLFVLYNPQRLPDPRATSERWRAACREAGFDGIYLVAAQTFGFFDPDNIGFDAAVEFPPHNAFTRDDITARTEFYGDFEGFVAEYRQLSENYPMDKTEYTLFKTVVPAWDNTARRGLNASVYHGSTPDAYMHWLRQAIRATLENNLPDQQFVFLNAWNEWAEGTYLEPDRDYGYAYLNATTRALQTTRAARPKLLIVGHDAFRAGSQIVLLNVLRWLKDHTHFDLRLILGRGGDLLEDYQSIVPTLILDKIRDEPRGVITTKIKQFCGEDVRLIYTNTGVSGWILPYLEDIDAPVLTHVHELQTSIEKFVGEDVFELSKAATDRFIAVSDPVKENLIRRHGIDEARIEVVHPFIKERSREEDKKPARDLLGLKWDVPLIFGCGTLDWRKGPDLFLDTAGELVRRGHEDFHFYWIGKTSDDFSDFEDEIWTRGLGNQVTYLGEKEDPAAYFAAGDIFLLPSREDPYPLVVLEAAQASLPSVCFSEAGGIPAFIGEGDDSCGFVVPFEDVNAMADAIERLIADPEMRTQMGGRAKEKLLAQHTIDVAMPHILKIIRETADLKPGVSVIVPAHNHGKYLPNRLESIFNQTYRDIEVLILDDASTDNTVNVLSGYASRPDVTIEINEENSGSPFAQWAKGIEASRADIIWIAEDDDTCEPQFLEALLKYFDDPAVKLAYAQSYAIDEEGEKLFSYKGYTDDISPVRWEKSYVESAEDEVNLALAVKNTIPNASAVLFRRFDASQWIEEWRRTNLAGDWALYLFAIRDGKMAFHPEQLNSHRRHESTNIHRTRFDDKRFAESVRVQRLAMQLYDVSENTRERMEKSAFRIWQEVHPREDIEAFKNAYQQNLGVPVPVYEPELVRDDVLLCPICQSHQRMVSAEDWLRDHFRCTSCNSLPRDRAHRRVLDAYFPGWKEKGVYEVGPANDLIRRVSTSYFPSHYFPGHPLGKEINEFRNEDIEALTYEDESIDVLVHLDVMEHVFHPERAAREMARVLRSGGVAVFTVPIHASQSESRRRARLGSLGEVDHILPAEYHEDPIGNHRALVTWDYGEDFETLVKEWLGDKADVEVTRINTPVPEMGIEGHYLDVIVLEKNVYPAKPSTKPDKSIGLETTLHDGFYERFREVPDSEWVDIIVRSIKHRYVDDTLFPGVPDDQLQRLMVGSSGEQAFIEASGFYLAIKRYLNEMNIPLNWDSKVLDFGCGYGRHLRFFYKDVPTTGLYGVDIDEDFIDICKTSMPEAHFKRNNAMPPLDFPDHHFDLIYAFSVFSHLNKDTGLAWIGEFSRILNPGGVLVVSTHRRSFIDFCASLREQDAWEHPWYEVLAKHAFHDTEDVHRAFDEGEFIFASTGGGGVRSPDFYGDAIVSPKFVQLHWLDNFDFVDYSDDPAEVGQAIIVLKHKA